MPTINAYRVIDVSEILRARDAIATSLIGQRATAAGDAGLQVSPVSGALYFADDDNLWSNSQGAGLPQDSDAAKQAARQWLSLSRKRLAATKPRPAVEPDALLPNGLDIREAIPVFPPGGLLPDHWLVRFDLKLPTGLPGPVDMANTDAIFDLRIGSAGTVVGLCSTWRPVEHQPLAEELVEPPAGTMPLIYPVGSFEQPQSVVSPFYLEPSADGGVLWPASAMTLLVALSQHSDGEITNVTATVLRGAELCDDTELELEWGAWRIDDPWADFISLGTGTTVQLPGTGVYNVAVDVQDSGGGRLERAQLIVFAGASSAAGPLSAMSSQWTFDSSVQPGYGVVLKNVRHQLHMYATDIRVVGLRVASSVADGAIGKGTPIRLGSDACPRVESFDDGAPVLKPDDPLPSPSPRDWRLIRSYPNPQIYAPALFRTKGAALADGSQPLLVSQCYVMTDYGKDPPHEPGALVNAARLYPLLLFRVPAARNSKKAIVYIRVDYRLELALEPATPTRTGSYRDLACLTRDNDQFPLNIRSGPLQHPLRYIFDNIEKPLGYEVLGEGLDWNNISGKGDWDNVHLWAAEDGLPPTPGANHAAHIHWRWGRVAVGPDVPTGVARGFRPTISPSGLTAEAARSIVRSMFASRFAGILGPGSALVDPRLRSQRLRVAVTQQALGPGVAATNKKRFQDLIEYRAAQEIPPAGTRLVVWISVEARREPEPDEWAGTFFVHGSFFSHDPDVIAIIGKFASERLGDNILNTLAQFGVAGLHDGARSTSSTARWERPSALTDW
jgi:hypothetical protein